LKRILVAPLNWGLGHATRCIPIINALKRMGVEVILASDGDALHLLRAEFPDLQAFELPSYGVRYGSANMIYTIGTQLPRMLWAVRREQWATERLLHDHNIDGVISDNRYGCFSPKVKSVILTHQLRLRVPNRFLSWIANGVLARALRQFDAVWVPDEEDDPNLSGALSHGRAVHDNIQFMGILTRMSAYERAAEYDVAIVLSGPEPQRTILETRLMEQAIELPQDRFIVIQGKPGTKQHYFAADNVEVVSYLTSRDLNDVLLSSEVMVCRSGYSSIMDLAALGRKAILIPTPGQTEQEYLAEHLSAQNAFLIQQQDHLDLEKGLAEVRKNTTGFLPDLFQTDSVEAFLAKNL
jgi:predicted glycosyltransferase